MPQGGIRFSKIRDHFRRMWVFYIVGMILVLFLNHLAFTVTRPSFSDGETLKIMLLNVEMQLDEAALAADLQDAGIRSVQQETLAGIAAEDPGAGMLLKVQLVSGFGDIYITDAIGLEHLEKLAACADLSDVQAEGLAPVQLTHPESGLAFTGAVQLSGERYMVVPANSGNISQAKTALPLLAEMITE